MTTNFVPKVSGTGSLGYSNRRWDKLHVKEVDCTGEVSASVFLGDGSQLTGVTAGADGDSAYDIWIANGNTGTEQEFLNSLVGSAGATGPAGPAGADGDSAYETWLDEGNSGTQQDFLDSLVGAAGPQGPQGAPGNLTGSVTNLSASGHISASFYGGLGGTMGSHIIPSENAQFDLGNAEYKIRHLFLSDNSLWVGDQHKISIANGSMKFKKRNGVPLMLENAMANAHGSVFNSVDHFVAQGVLTLDGRDSITVGNLRLDEVYLIADQLAVPHENLFREEDMDNDFNDDVVELSTAGVGMLPDLATAKLGTMVYDSSPGEHNVKVVASDDNGATKVWKTLSFV